MTQSEGELREARDLVDLMRSAGGIPIDSNRRLGDFRVQSGEPNAAETQPIQAETETTADHTDDIGWAQIIHMSFRDEAKSLS